ncbi:MiaB/RimO family radical SAM methylthiotransferase [Patescibacteria group bacterium]|nr:MiaB/RimO family radical SAM methylthiotransferase [Patescibacteria group bacterium]
MLSRKLLKTFHIKTYGCQANIADSIKLSEELANIGLFEVDSLEEADLFVINSCSVRQKSEDKVYGWGRILGKYTVKPYIVLTGCIVGSARGKRRRFSFKELERKTPWVNMYVEPNDLLSVPDRLLEKGFTTKESYENRKNYNTNEIGEKSFCKLSDFSVKKENIENALVNISYGCDNFCTYCVVPYARGEEVSRSQGDILAEVKEAVKKGAKKITLCGQNVNSWGLNREAKFKLRTGGVLPPELGDKLPFTKLLHDVNQIEGIKEIEFISSNPFDFTQDLIDALKLEKISNYLHIAVQSGNNDILQKMNRRHTVEEFKSLINKIRKVRPDMEFGTDVIVGFPSETRDQFMDTADLFRKVKFSVAFISMYSQRKGTAAALLKDDVSRKEKRWRHNYLLSLWREIKNEK